MFILVDCSVHVDILVLFAEICCSRVLLSPQLKEKEIKTPVITALINYSFRTQKQPLLITYDNASIAL